MANALMRAELMKAGIPKGDHRLGIFDRSTLGATNFLNTVNFQRALQDEIRRTLRQIEGVIDAAVMLLTRASVFEDEKRSRPFPLPLICVSPIFYRSQVQAIVNFVAGCVTGMRPEHVTIR